MIHLENYRNIYDEQLKEIDMVTFFTVNYHADVIKSSICAVFDGDSLLAVGYLKAGATFLKVEELSLPYYFIHAEYIADDEADIEAQIEASQLILEELKRRFDELQEHYKDKRLILRLWCNAEKTAYQEFLMMLGFRPMRIMPIMVRKLTDEDSCADEEMIEPDGEMIEPDEEMIEPDEEMIEPDGEMIEPDGEVIEPDEEIILPDGEHLQIREMNPFDDSFMHAYTLTNREAFEVEDSENELRFVMGGEDSHVFCVMKEDRVIAAVTLWRITPERAATENIFCAADYRRKGITAALIDYACDYLRKKGYEEASLTVFGDNMPATQLYLKLGYELEGNMLELHYEKTYKNVGY